MNKILIINSSIRGTQGNSWLLCKIAQEYLNSKHLAKSEIFTLTDTKSTLAEIHNLLNQCSGFLVVSGVYWNNWASCLQRFIEVVTPFENSLAFFGKPIACAITMDSVGGSEVASRIHSVFSGLGCWSPPCSTLVVSRVGQEAVLASKGDEDDPNNDVWRIDDIEIVLQNLVTAANFTTNKWVAWPHVELKIEDSSWPEFGPLNMETPIFVS